jgi:hypothetical protein
VASAWWKCLADRQSVAAMEVIPLSQELEFPLEDSWIHFARSPGVEADWASFKVLTVELDAIVRGVAGFVRLERKADTEGECLVTGVALALDGWVAVAWDLPEPLRLTEEKPLGTVPVQWLLGRIAGGQ